MTMRRVSWAVDDWRTVAEPMASHYLCDTDAELPPTAPEGSIAVSKQSGSYTRVGNAWTQPSSAPSPGGSRFPQAISLGNYLVVTNVGAAYDAVALAQGLGLAAIDWTGVSSVLFLVRVNRVGTGTQSWQLWNETDGVEIGVINDAAAGTKVLSGTFTPNLTGVKLVRVRAKSTVATDDPVYYGSTVLLS